MIFAKKKGKKLRNLFYLKLPKIIPWHFKVPLTSTHACIACSPCEDLPLTQLVIQIIISMPPTKSNPNLKINL